LIVLDANVAADVILRSPIAPRLVARLDLERAVHVPEHFHVEVLSVLRRHALRGALSERRAAEALDDLRAMRVERHPVLDTDADIWDLRHRLTVYDAAYLAVARRLDAPLLTLDAGLAAVAREDGRLAVLT
jgi:predicted nucleic acid-binding protein